MKWISIKKQLPETHNDYIEYLVSNGELIWLAARFKDNNDNINWTLDDGDIIDDVTHWAELPEPPAEESS